MVTKISELLMAYFPDNRPASFYTLQRKCDMSVLESAIENGYITEVGKDSDGFMLYVITENGRKYRDQ